jgi:ribosome recycling factor
MMDDTLKTLEQAASKSMEDLRQKLAKVRTGRASASLLDDVKATYYGSLTPLKQMANITVPEARLIIIQPYDPTTLKEIEKTIFAADLGLTPQNDGKVIRIPVPELTEERRKEMVKVVNKIAEDHRVGVRSARKEANDELKKLKKDKQITDDEYHRGLDKIQERVDEIIEELDKISAAKEEEILKI